MKAVLKTLCIFFLMLPFAARAERADALKTVKIDYDDIHIDNVTRNAIATGNVIITRGSMVLSADRAVVKETPEGYRTFLLTASPGKLVRFRQKRDGGPDLWSEGHAERMEYDERADVINLDSKAMIRQLEGTKVMQEMEHAFISYNSREDVLLGRGGRNGTDASSHARGSVTFETRHTRTPTPAMASTSESATATATAAK